PFRHDQIDISSVFRERYDFAPATPIHLMPDLARAHLFDAQTGQRIAQPYETTMSDFNRRKFLEGSASVAAAATLGSSAAVFAPAVHAQGVTFEAEQGAKLPVLRRRRCAP